jgi:hypothetical protein
MSYTLLQLVDQVSGELGLTQPAAVIGSSNNQTIQLLALAQRLGKDLVRDYEWQRLVQAYIWQTQNAVSTTGNITANSKVITNIPEHLWLCKWGTWLQAQAKHRMRRF